MDRWKKPAVNIKHNFKQQQKQQQQKRNKQQKTRNKSSGFISWVENLCASQHTSKVKRQNQEEHNWQTDEMSLK